MARAHKYLIKRWFAQVSGTREVEKQLRRLETLSDFAKTVSVLRKTLTVFVRVYIFLDPTPPRALRSRDA